MYKIQIGMVISVFSGLILILFGYSVTAAEMRNQKCVKVVQDQSKEFRTAAI